MIGTAFACVLLAVGASTPPDTILIDGGMAYRVQSPEVHDADTLTDGVIRLPFGAAIAGRSIRADYDAWEIRRGRRTVTITEAELAAGQKAADELRQMLTVGTLYLSPVAARDDIDPYDRIDARWYYRDQAGKVRPVKVIATERGWVRGAR